MRVLMLPLIGQKSNIASESCFVNFRWLWRKAKERWPRFYAHVAVPEEIATLCAENLTDEERTYIEIIPERIPFPFHVQECVFDPVLVSRFNRYCGTDWVDMVFTARLPIGQALQLSLRDWRATSGCPRIVMWEPGIDQDFFAQGAFADPARLAKAYSLATCPNQYLTQREFNIGLEWARRFLSPKMITEVMRLGKVLQPALKSVAETPTENPKKHTMFFGARLNATKRIDWIVDFYSKVFSLGHDVDVLVTCPGNIKPRISNNMRLKGKGKDGENLVEWISKCGREQFAEVMKRATICVIASSYEGFPFGFLQIAASGMLTLFPDQPWARDTMPKGYPWIYRNEAEALSWVSRAMRGEWKAMVKAQLAVVRQAHGAATADNVDYDEQRWRFFTQAGLDEPWFAGKTTREDNPIVQMIRDLSLSEEGFTLAEACAHVAKHSEQITARHWEAPPAGFWPRSFVHRVLTTMLGMEDACDGPTPRYVRPDGSRDVADAALAVSV